jgi:ribosomal protein S18 acetylase RimI-like enzyme
LGLIKNEEGCGHRESDPGDLDAIGNLWQEFMDFHRKREAHFSRSMDGHERFKEFLTGHIASETSCVLVAQQNGKVVGYCLAMLAKYPPVFEKRDYGTVFDLAVTERSRRSGIGEKMYATVQAWFSERGVQRVEVRVAVSNETSTAFWRKMGFKPFVETVFKNI